MKEKEKKEKKEIMIILISLILIVMTTNVFASDLVIGDNGSTTITGNEYDNAQIPEEENTNTGNETNNNAAINTNTSNTNTSNTNTNKNTAKTYNTNNKTDLPQTGIEDYNIGILLIICVASAMFAYKKVNDYRNI